MYTLIDVYPLEDIHGEEIMQCFVANYSRKEDAVKALECKLREYDYEVSDNNFERLFDDMVKDGFSIDTMKDGQKDMLFVRNQPVHDSFSSDQVEFE